jgi:hypothetical protein
MQCHGKPSSIPSRFLTASFALLILVGIHHALAQSSASSSSSNPQAAPKSPALVDTAGPDISLQNSEALFDIAAALNSCGYDQGLAVSDPVRQEVRDLVNQALQASAEARDAHEKICTFIDQHRLSDTGSDLAQYISLALYVSAPPDLTPSGEGEEMPPDASGVENILPLLRSFGQYADLHVIWLRVRPQYDKQLARAALPGSGGAAARPCADECPGLRSRLCGRGLPRQWNHPYARGTPRIPSLSD